VVLEIFLLPISRINVMSPIPQVSAFQNFQNPLCSTKQTNKQYSILFSVLSSAWGHSGGPCAAFKHDFLLHTTMQYHSNDYNNEIPFYWLQITTILPETTCPTVLATTHCITTTAIWAATSTIIQDLL
jgi:hypothetical protein